MKQKVVCVLGMHRSGTSVLMNIINNMGVYIGSDQKIMKKQIGNNDEGFFEHIDLVQVNDKILRTFGREWYNTSELPSNWVLDHKVISLKTELKNVINLEFDEKKIWGFKDPRTCLSLPLFQSVFSDLNQDPYYVISIRHPYEVALSLRKRDNMSLNMGLRLWYFYTLNFLIQTAGEKRKIIFYDELISNEENVVRELYDFLELEKSHIFVPCIKKGLKRNSCDSNIFNKINPLICSLYNEIKVNANKNIIDLTKNLEEFNLYANLMQVDKADEKPTVILCGTYYENQVGENISKYDVEAVINLDQNGDFILKEDLKIDQDINQITWKLNVASKRVFIPRLIIDKVVVNNKESNCVVDDVFCKEDQCYIFAKNYISITLKEKNVIENIVIKGNIKFNESSDEVNKLIIKINDLKNIAIEEKNKIEEVLNKVVSTRMWKMMNFFRRIRDLFLGVYMFTK